MAKPRPRSPDHLELLLEAASVGKPLAIVLAGHNGSGKSTFWYDKLADSLQIPLINADRLTLSILPPASDPILLPTWASTLRDQNEKWQRVSQEGVQLYLGLVMHQQLPFAFETVFSYLQQQPDGTYRSKADTITALRDAGYYVVLIFIGLTTAEVSVSRVAMRKARGGHDVPDRKLFERFPRTQQAIRIAAPQADMTLMFDNSRGFSEAFTLARAQVGMAVRYDCRDGASTLHADLRRVASVWLSVVAPQ